MRTLRLPLVGTAILMSLAGLATSVIGQSDEAASEELAPVHFAAALSSVGGSGQDGIEFGDGHTRIAGR